MWSVLLNGRGHGAGKDIFTANIHLAGDRVRGECDVNVVGLNILYNILIDPMLELVSKRSGAWVLHYVKSAFAVTDTPDWVRCAVCINRSCWRYVVPGEGD